MGHTPSVKEMIAVVEDYIYAKKRKKVKIVFDNPMNMHKHIIMLNEAYNVAIAYNNKEK